VHQLSTLKSTDVLAVKHVPIPGGRAPDSPLTLWETSMGMQLTACRVHPRGVVFQKQLFHLLTVLVLRNRPWHTYSRACKDVCVQPSFFMERRVFTANSRSES